MKIESVHIENFGKLHDFSMSFLDGTNVIKESNGWGKSTLATFIRSMFYGLEGEGKRDTVFNERKRFKPWQGGAFGGSLIFETKGKRYRIERSFATKSSEDTFKLYDVETGLESSDFDSNIGEKLFHINSESFRKTVFISQNDCSNSGTSGDINSRIGNIEDSIDLNKYEEISTKIKDSLNHLSTTKRGKQGILNEKMSYIKGNMANNSDVDRTIDEIIDRIEEKEAMLKALKEEERNLNNRRSAALKAQKAIAKREEYEKLTGEVASKSSDYETEKNWFPQKPVEISRITEWENAVKNIEEARTIISKTELLEAEQTAFNEYSSMFKDGVPEESEHEKYVNDAARILELKEEKSKYALSEEEADKLSFYNELFKNEDNVPETIKKLSDKWDEKSGIDASIEKVNEKIDKINAHKESLERASLIKLIIFMIIGLLVSALGLFLLVKKVNPVSLALIITGIVLCVVGVILRSIGNKKAWKANLDSVSLKNEIEALTTKKKQAEKVVKDYLDRHKIAVETTVKECLWTLKSEADRFEYLKKQASLSTVHDTDNEIMNLISGLNAYLFRFGIDCTGKDYGVVLSDLYNKSIRFKDLSKRSTEAIKAKENEQKLLDNLSEQLRAFGFEPMMDIASQISQIKEHASMTEEKRKLLSDAEGRKQEFEQSNDMEEVLREFTAEELSGREELDQLTEEIGDRKSDIEDAIKTERRNLDIYQEKKDEYDENAQELNELNELYQDARKKFETLTLVRDYLEQAKINLTKKYIDPLEEGFKKYYGILADPEEVYMLDANMTLTKREQGMQRDTSSLSFGYQDLCGFCMRLSLADAMYKGEKPVLIFDDPFVNLDDEKMDGARKLLSEVEKKYQVIYMTCRENRV